MKAGRVAAGRDDHWVGHGTLGRAAPSRRRRFYSVGPPTPAVTCGSAGWAAGGFRRTAQRRSWPGQLVARVPGSANSPARTTTARPPRFEVVVQEPSFAVADSLDDERLHCGVDRAQIDARQLVPVRVLNRRFHDGCPARCRGRVFSNRRRRPHHTRSTTGTVASSRSSGHHGRPSWKSTRRPQSTQCNAKPAVWRLIVPVPCRCNRFRIIWSSSYPSPIALLRVFN